MGEQLPLEPPWKVGAGLRRRDVELGKVVLMLCHVRSTESIPPPARLVEGRRRTQSTWRAPSRRSLRRLLRRRDRLALGPVDNQDPGKNVVQAALALVEKGPEQDRTKHHQREPKQERMEGRDKRRDLATEPHGHLEPHHSLADGRRLRAADRQRVITEPDDRKDKAEQQPSQSER